MKQTSWTVPHPILALLGGVFVGFGFVGVLVLRSFIAWLLAVGGFVMMLKGIFGEREERA